MSTSASSPSAVSPIVKEDPTVKGKWIIDEKYMALRRELFRARPMWAKIVTYQDMGHSVAEIARLLRCTSSSIRLHMKAMRKCGLLPPMPPAPIPKGFAKAKKARVKPEKVIVEPFPEFDILSEAFRGMGVFPPNESATSEEMRL